jgi:hypothetical protein
MNLAALFLCVWAFSEMPAPTKVVTFPEQKDIKLEIWQKTPLPCPVYWLAVHENEAVANAYVAKHILDSGGLLAVIRQRGDRHIFLKHQDAEYKVDPNRVFTEKGAAATLTKLNPQLEADSEAHRALTKRALALGGFMLEPLHQINEEPIIIALHNNTDGYDDDGKDGVGTVSIQRYLNKFKGGSGFIADLHVSHDHDEDDLFFITDVRDFLAMKKDEWNVLLQHKQVATLANQDDGSLSVFSEMKGWRYVNIEAQRDPDHLEKQQEMVRYILKLMACP